MAITTMDDLIAGMQPPADFTSVGVGTQIIGRMFSPFYSPGFPGPATVPSPGMAGAALTSYPGQLPFINGADDQYLARFAAMSNTMGIMFLCDRLWHNSGIAVATTTAQTVDSATLPARDLNASTNGEGIRVGLEISTATGAGASTHSLVYTNSAGTGSKTASPRVAYTANSLAGVFYDYTLADGDTGVRSIQSFTSSVSMTSGVVHLVMYRVIARIAVPVIGLEYALDALTSGMPKLHNNTVPFILWQPASITAPTLLGGQFIQSNG